jgi:hypothetical protein
MSKRIPLIILAVLLVASIVIAIILFQSANGFMQAIAQTNDRLGQTIVKLTQAEDTLAQRESDWAQLTSRLSQTAADLDKTRDELASVKSEKNISETTYSFEKASLELELAWVAKQAESTKFYFYYVKPKQQYGVNNLSSYLSGRQWLREYEANVFDCSEMSAYVERDLECYGFHTLIAVGNSPSGSNLKHAWLLVEVESGKYMPVEATTTPSPSVVWQNNPNFNNYLKCERTFDTIQEALAYAPSEFDWWTP